MYTSAQALNELLVNIAAINKPKSRFLDVAAEYLGLSGDDPFGDAAFRIRKLYIRVRNDLEAVELDERSMTQFRSRLNPFAPLETFSQMHMTLGEAKNNFLKPDNLNGLTLVHGALYGNVCRFDLQLDLQEISDNISKLKDGIAELNIPSELKKILYKRVSQMQCAIDHYKVFGLDGLADSIEELVGSIVLYVDKELEESNNDWFFEMKKMCAYTLKSIEKARKAADNIKIIKESVPALTDAGRKILGLFLDVNGGE